MNTDLLPGSGTSLQEVPSGIRNYSPDWAWSRLTSSYGLWHGDYNIDNHWPAFATNYNNKQGVYFSPILTNGSVSYTRMDTVMKIRNFAGNAGLLGHLHTLRIDHALTLAYFRSTLVRSVRPTR